MSLPIALAEQILRDHFGEPPTKPTTQYVMMAAAAKRARAQ
jgi:hypothetical protein